ncbi:hypothetical protein C819_00881 [Lachnospiraceae bacterium 10-1]|jgi:hypothetical protein|uniref:DUF4879 domain-containing protein n=1 Tax=Bacteroides TaxID=816 RepID=UPI000334AB0C|nr:MULTISPECIES: DUF4879 domain-containing protein [Bacteroides]EOS77770.1 hypothetical protein C819_00881 [Lachnospiraceae bacterium 10-1]MDE6601369.1 YolA family protein [Lachnospiraceae bacterium]
MKKFKKLLSVMLVSTLLVANVIPVSAAEIQPRDAAPALTQFYVYSVSSEKGGTEVIQRSGSFAQVGTTLDHGGTWLEVETIEIGYAKTRSATLNSTNMTLKSKKAIDLDNDRIIDGWACVWRYENSYGFEAGTFKASSKSANSPWNTMNITFYIH